MFVASVVMDRMDGGGERSTDEIENVVIMRREESTRTDYVNGTKTLFASSLT